MDLLVTVWMVVSLGISGVQAGSGRSGPFKLELERFERCEDEGTGAVVWGTKMYRTPDGGHVYNNTIYHGHPVDKDFKTKLEVQSFSNGGYRPRYMLHNFKGCDEIWKYFQFLYTRFEWGGEPIEKCPVPAGNYTLRYDVHQEIVGNIPSMIYNKYRIITAFYYKGKRVGCLASYGEIGPKE